MQTGIAQSILPTGATLTGTVNPEGSATNYWFEWGSSTSYGSRTAATAAGSGTAKVSVSAAVTGLKPLTTYHFRVDASSGAGTSFGSDASFTTGGYQNPVFGAAATPDPFVLDNGGTHNDYYAFTTGNLFPVLRSRDLVNWTSAGTAMAATPPWVVQTGDWHPWAPSVVHVNSSCPNASTASCYIMFYVGLSAQFSTNCVAIATSPSPAGPYTDHGPLALSNGATDAKGRPIGCGDNAGYGMIDPSPFTDPATGTTYLYGSEDFSCPSGSSSCDSANSTLQPTISVIPLSPNLLSASAGRTALFSGRSGTWESAGVSVPTVEGPTAMLHGNVYYLLYSGGDWQGAYGMGYATSTSPTGPFTRPGSNQILSQTTTVLSPGGGDTPVLGPRGATWMVYHGRDSSYANPRTLRIDPFTWTSVSGSADVPTVNGPTSTPQPTQP